MKTFFRFSYFVRLFVIFFLAFGIVRFVPVFFFEKIPNVANPLYGLIVFVFLSGFLINQAMDRNSALHVNVALELSRTRRIIHLIENMNANGVWKKEIKKLIVTYLQRISMHDFSQYHESNAQFRLLSHKIYSYVPKTKKDEALFGELLIITREIAFQRQELISNLSSPVSSYTWVVFSLVGVIDIVLLLLIRDLSLLGTSFTFFVSTIILLIADLLIELSILTKAKRVYFQNLYGENSQRINKE